MRLKVFHVFVSSARGYCYARALHYLWLLSLSRWAPGAHTPRHHKCCSLAPGHWDSVTDGRYVTIITEITILTSRHIIKPWIYARNSQMIPLWYYALPPSSLYLEWGLCTWKLWRAGEGRHTSEWRVHLVSPPSLGDKSRAFCHTRHVSKYPRISIYWH